MFVQKSMDTKERICTYALSRIFRNEPKVAKAIIDTLGSASTIFEMDSDSLTELMGPYNRHRESISQADIGSYEKELDRALDGGGRYLIYKDEGFPEILGECPDAPVGFFYKSGSAPADVFGRESIAVVGTRNITPYGAHWCRNIVASLAHSDTRPTIVSGLAYGVDITAHLTALESGLPTIAVLGTGITNIYPSAHTRHAQRIMETPGCAIICEHPDMDEVYASNFLSRNRIIAGLCRATVLIESKLKGGGMHTARMAASYNRMAFALPGRNDDPYSQGCNYLIQSHIAEPIIGCDEFFHTLDYTLGAEGGKGQPQSLADFYSGSMDSGKIELCQRLYVLICAERGISIGQLAQSTGCAYAQVASALQRMENDGFIDIDLIQRCSATRKKP